MFRYVSLALHLPVGIVTNQPFQQRNILMLQVMSSVSCIYLYVYTYIYFFAAAMFAGVCRCSLLRASAARVIQWQQQADCSCCGGYRHC